MLKPLHARCPAADNVTHLQADIDIPVLNTPSEMDP